MVAVVVVEAGDGVDVVVGDTHVAEDGEDVAARERGESGGDVEGDDTGEWGML